MVAVLQAELAELEAPRKPEEYAPPRHDSPMEPEPAMSPAAMRAKMAEVQLQNRQKGRHDSAISPAPAMDKPSASNPKPVNLGASMLKTPSIAASSKCSPTSSKPDCRICDFTGPPAATEAVAGSTWLWKYDGKLWPVVLCDEKTAPKKFMDTRHHPSDLPAILLGRRI